MLGLELIGMPLIHHRLKVVLNRVTAPTTFATPLNIEALLPKRESTANISTPNSNVILSKRDAASDICGSNTGGKIATDTRDADTWNKYNIDQWIIDK